MRGRVKVSTALVMALIMIFSMFLPTIRVLATDINPEPDSAPQNNEQDTCDIILGGVLAPGLGDDTSINFACDEDGSYVIIEILNADTFEDNLVFEPDEFTHPSPQGGEITDWGVRVNKYANLAFTIVPVEGKDANSVWYNGQQELTHPSDNVEGGREWNLNNIEDNCNVDINIEEQLPSPDGNPTNEVGNPNSNSTSTVTISGQRFTDARMMLNDTGVEFIPIEDINETWEDESITRIVHYNTEPEATTVTMYFETLFIQKFTGNININGTNYPVTIDYNNREKWLDHYANQCVGFEIEVPKAETYNIQVTVDEQPGDKQFIGNFLWTGNEEEKYDKFYNPETDREEIVIDDETGEPRTNDNYIGNSKLELVKMVYERNGQEITVDFKDEATLQDIFVGQIELGGGNWYNFYSDGNFEYGYQLKKDNQSVNYDNASLVVPEGAKVTMKSGPEYGYQVNSFGINGADIITGENISEFTFEVRKGNFHLGAQVEEVGNDVATGENTGIKSGTVEIANGVLEEGTARLFVENNEDVSKEKVAEFEEAAKDYLADGYQISNYLDISLAQVFYKGTGNANDVWVADELEDTHTKMTLELEDEDFDPETTAIIHNIKDGEEFEEVDYEYDADTNSITLETDTFSTFAVVSKTKVASNDDTTKEKENTTNTPKTGDNVIVVISILIVAVVALLITMKIKRNIKTSKNN